ncbi:MAG TPA: hypothetical protein VGQ81_08165 [Acidobacteriota bacterium]|jgi:hypothetical protein|nr:hypothetical protein [Acidobacteriota bacterium]
MRTTLTLDEDVLRSARRKAVEEGRPLKEIINEALRLGLSGITIAHRKKIRVQTHNCAGTAVAGRRLGRS